MTIIRTQRQARVRAALEHIALRLVHYRVGRAVLHLACAAANRKARWHARGIIREFS